MSNTSLSRARRGLTAVVAGGALVAGVLAFGTPAQAAAPSNDNFANAAVISGTSLTLTASNEDATIEPGEPLNMGNDWSLGASIWYRWTAPVTADYAVSLAGSDFDTELGVYTGSSVAALTRVTSDDDSLAQDDGTSGTGFAATAGTTYFIQVGGYGTESPATGTVRLALGPAAVAGSMTYDSTDTTAAPLSGCLAFFTDASDETAAEGSVVDSGCGIGTAGAASAYALGLLPAGSYYVIAIEDGTPIYYPGVANIEQATKLTIPAGGCTLTGLNVDFNTMTFAGPTGKSCALSPACISAKATVGSTTTVLGSDRSALTRDKHAVKKLHKKLKKSKKHHKSEKSAKKLHKKLKRAKRKARSASNTVRTATTALATAQRNVTASC